MKEFKFKISGQDYSATVAEENAGSLVVTVNGQAYQGHSRFSFRLRALLCHSTETLENKYKDAEDAEHHTDTDACHHPCVTPIS